ncbi:hypothetical protein BDD43_5814 [Mucilaginibacter gracilis]|uniref:Uncharacterized protein n=1 Tax=Mucilaginibacter gracilis TaxID=423350 RepID=A0A495J9R4_9SPHI|nr:hypothetical protein BDD43_5814 [Mucilaginibacter gracilis]
MPNFRALTLWIDILLTVPPTHTLYFASNLVPSCNYTLRATAYFDYEDK